MADFDFMQPCSYVGENTAIFLYLTDSKSELFSVHRFFTKLKLRVDVILSHCKFKIRSHPPIDSTNYYYGCGPLALRTAKRDNLQVRLHSLIPPNFGGNMQPYNCLLYTSDAADE